MAINPYVPATAVGNGTQVDFSFTFSYIFPAHVIATINGVATTNFTFFSRNILRFNTPPANGATVRIFRETPGDGLAAVIQPGGPLPIVGLNNNFLQSLYYSQETQYDAANQSTAGLQAQINGITVTSNTALATAGSAVTTANAATATANGIAATANTALSTSSAAVATANLALDKTGRNRIINGNFDIWQNGITFTGDEYGADQWLHARVGTAHIVTRQQFTLGQTAVPGEPRFFCRTVVSSVAGANNYSVLLQRLEDVRTFAGQQVTVSFWAKADATKSIAVELAQGFGTGGSPSAGVTAIGVTKTSIGTGWQLVTVTATVPSISGKTLGTDNNDHLVLTIWFDAGSNFNSRTGSLGQQSGSFDISQVQIEPGSVATSFERRPIGVELALCQRYYLDYGVFHIGMNGNANAQGDGAFPVQMRAFPNISYTDVNGVAGQVTIWNGGFNNNTFSSGGLSADTKKLICDATASFSSSTSSWLRAYNVKLSARL